MNTNLLYIPFRQSRPIDLGQELTQIINRDYFQPVSNFTSDLSTISTLRNSITQYKNEQVSKQQEQELIQYLGCLELIQVKFPDDCIEFCWFGNLAYGPFKYRSFQIEQLSVLYQLGGVYSQLALKESRHTDQGLKNACNYFQLAAGCFERISSSIIGNIPSDLQHNTSECLKYIMLAQAQETIWQKALTSSTVKHSVILKLSFQTSEFYSQALEYGNKSDIKLEWLNHLTIKKYHFQAASYLRRANIAQDSFNYGEQVAYLRIANKLLDIVRNYKNYVNKLVLDDFQGLYDTIKSSLKSAERDNNLIYLKLVPGEQDLPKLVGVSMVHPISPTIPKCDLFQDLLPYLVIHVSQAFKQRQEDFIKETFHDPIHKLNSDMLNYVSERGLPASIDSIQQSENIPDSILKYCREFTNMGGIQLIEDSLVNISELREQCMNIVKECEQRSTLVDEIPQELSVKIDKMKQYLNQAKIGDDAVKDKYLDIKPYLEIYSQGYQGLTLYIPNSNYTKLDESVSTIVSDLRKVLGEIDQLTVNRRQFLNSIDIKSRDNNILSRLIQEYQNHTNSELTEQTFEPVYDQHLKIFSSDLTYIETQTQLQSKLQGELDILNNRFIQESGKLVSKLQLQRQQALQSLQSGYCKYMEIIGNVNEGSKFYNDFINRSNGVLKECQDYLYTKRIESRDSEHVHDTATTTVEVISPKTTKSIWNDTTEIKF